MWLPRTHAPIVKDVINGSISTMHHITSQLSALILLSITNVAVAGDHGTLVAAGDQIWLVSARKADHCDVDPALLPCQKFCGGCWSESSFDQLESSGGQQLQTVVFVHGYRTDLEAAQETGVRLYRNLFGNECRQSGPIRLVIWAWKTEMETCRPLQDFNRKTERAMSLKDTFARTLTRLGPAPPVVIAYSLGTQVVVSAAAQSDRYRGTPFELAVIAAATDCGFSSHCHELSQCGNIARTTVFLNEGDRAIRVARLACRVTHGRMFQPFEDFAPGYSSQLGSIELIDITGQASRKHSIIRYTEVPVVRAAIQGIICETRSGIEDRGIVDSQ